MLRKLSLRGFTLVEMTMTLASVGILGVVLGVFGFSTSRFVARNLATNHSNESARISAQSLLKEARDSATSFRLFDFNGTTCTDVTTTVTTDLDALTGEYASNRANGVRFRQLVAGPLKMTSNTTPATTSLTFNFPAGTPSLAVGDKVLLPLISEEYEITGVTGTGTSRTVTLSTALGFTLNTSTSPNFITGYFYRRVAYTVYNNQLRFHPNFNSSNAVAGAVVIRNHITSPKPFSMLYEAGFSEALALRVSLEVTDLGYRNRKFRNGTTTLYTVIPARVQPTILSSND